MRKLPLIVLALLLSAAPATADSLGVTVLSNSYVTNVALNVKKFVGSDIESVVTTHSLSSTSPIVDEVHGSAKVFAKATADTFSVSSVTSALFDINLDEVSAFANADASSTLWFAPVQDGVAKLLLTFATGNFESRFTQGLVSLYDATANQTLWTYSSDGGVGNVPWTPDFDCCSGTVAISQAFFSSHVYLLTMHAGSDANTDSMRISAGISGLHTVPEPGTLSMLALGALGAAYRLRKREKVRG